MATPTTSLYTLRTVLGGAVEITHVPSRTLIATCPTVLIASKLVAVLFVAECDAPVEWNTPARDVLGLGQQGRKP